MNIILKLLFRPIYLMGLRDAAQIAQDYAFEIVRKPEYPDPLRAMTYSRVAQMVAGSNVANLIYKQARPIRLWPIQLLWRWHERNYAKQYRQRMHVCDSAEGRRDAGRVLHLWAVKVVLG